MSKLALALFLVSFLSIACPAYASDDNPWVVYDGYKGPGYGKRIVLIAGDEEYRSEEAMPQLGKILAVRHGFHCTVLFSVNPKDGTIDPNNQTNIPGLEHLESADMMILALRFRELPDEQMKYIVDFVESGKPILGLRTATHSFNYKRNKKSPYANYDFRNREWKGGFGQQVLGDTWISHHGHHGRESTRGVIDEKYASHPILKGVEDIWGKTDVYGVRNLIPEAHVLVHGQVLLGMTPDSKPNTKKKTMPLIWTKSFTGKKGNTSRIICTTMGASVDLESEGLRRVLVNSCYWGMKMEDKIPAESNVNIVGEYKPTMFGFGKFQKGLKPSDHKLKRSKTK